MPEGVFIAIEGIDGAGVTTQARHLQQNLEDELEEKEKLEYTLPLAEADVAATNGPPHTHLTKEPTDGPAGGQIRMALSERLELDPETIALFFATDRKDHIEQKIQPLLDDGYVVITDRYYLSSYAYQLDGVGGDLQWLQQINKKSISPDLTVLLDVEVETAKDRREKSRPGKELFEDDPTLKNVRENYIDIAKKLNSNDENIKVISAEGEESDIADQVFNEVVALLQEKDIITMVGNT